jgi:hypothetical protein
MRTIDRTPQADTRTRRNFDKVKSNFEEIEDLAFATAFSVMLSGIGQQAMSVANDTMAHMLVAMPVVQTTTDSILTDTLSNTLAIMPTIQTLQYDVLTEAFLAGSAYRGI